MYKNLVLVDGEIMPAEEAAVSVHDRGHQLGDGVFEIVLFIMALFCFITSYG